MSWAEAYDLAAQLKEVQSEADGVRFSERHCIELVSKLIEKRMVNLVFSQDGKEYITRDHLHFEVEQEIEYASGRVSLLKICEALNVSVDNIEPILLNIVSKDPEMFYINNDVVQQKYLNSLAEELNQKLQKSGMLTFVELSNKYDLPLAFMHEHISTYFGNVINGSYAPDKMSIMSLEHQTTLKTKIIDELKASTKPVTLKAISSVTQVPDSFLLDMVEDLLKSKALEGSIPGTVDINSVYVPDVFVKYQKDSVVEMIDSTQIAKYSQLLKLGISDPKRSMIPFNWFKWVLIVFHRTCAVTWFGPVIRQSGAKTNSALNFNYL